MRVCSGDDRHAVPGGDTAPLLGVRRRAVAGDCDDVSPDVFVWGAHAVGVERRSRVAALGQGPTGEADDRRLAAAGGAHRRSDTVDGVAAVLACGPPAVAVV